MLTVEQAKLLYLKGVDFKTFYGHSPDVPDSCFSNWFLSPFEVDGIVYSCGEQYMMASKATLFMDKNRTYNQVILDRIMSEGNNNPRACKRLGRAVKGFDEKIWYTQCSDILIKGLFEKFRQGDGLKDYISQFKGIFVEASPIDGAWGVKVAGAPAQNPFNWKGRNLLGFVLTEVRNLLVGEVEYDLSGSLDDYKMPDGVLEYTQIFNYFQYPIMIEYRGINDWNYIATRDYKKQAGVMGYSKYCMVTHLKQKYNKICILFGQNELKSFIVEGSVDDCRKLMMENVKGTYIAVNML